MSAEQTYFDQETTTRILDYTVEVEGLRTPDEVLNRLDDIISEKKPIRVHGANRFSVKVGDWRHIELGRECLCASGCSSRMAGGVGSVCRKRTSLRADDRKDVPGPLHMDRAFATA
jgi:hypothetical protein